MTDVASLGIRSQVWAFCYDAEKHPGFEIKWVRLTLSETALSAEYREREQNNEVVVDRVLEKRVVSPKVFVVAGCRLPIGGGRLERTVEFDGADTTLITTMEGRD